MIRVRELHPLEYTEEMTDCLKLMPFGATFTKAFTNDKGDYWYHFVIYDEHKFEPIKCAFRNIEVAYDSQYKILKVDKVWMKQIIKIIRAHKLLSINEED